MVKYSIEWKKKLVLSCSWEYHAKKVDYLLHVKSGTVDKEWIIKEFGREFTEDSMDVVISQTGEYPRFAICGNLKKPYKPNAFTRYFLKLWYLKFKWHFTSPYPKHT